MNRVTVILLALVILLAHSLAIHQTNDGELAPPYDYAHVAYRVARNYVHHGAALWNPSGSSIESYPSPMWVAVSAVAERVYLPPTRFAQAIGVLCALATIAVLAQFSPRRMLGLVAPILLAASGSAAAAGTSGTEAALLMLLVTTAFLGFERLWRRRLAFVLCLLIATRFEGLAILAAFYVLELVNRPAETRARYRVYLVPTVFALVLTSIRYVWTGHWFSPSEHSLLPSAENAVLGYEYVRSFFLQSGSGLLIVLPLFGVLFRRVTAAGRRAFFLVVLWCLVVLVQGGSGLPMWNALAPMLPLFFLSVQGTIRRWIDKSPRLSLPSVLVLGFGIACSLLVSMTPGDIGPFRLQDVHRSWLRPSERMGMIYDRPLGRSGLIAEIKDTARLRSIGIFLRDKVRSPSLVMTPWPGAVGYISRQSVGDLLGRATLSPGEKQLHPWSGAQRVDLIAALQTKPEYVLPAIDPYTAGSPLELLRDLLTRHDVVGYDQIRFRELLRALNQYELVSVPVPAKSEDPSSPSTTPFLLLRKKSLDLSPRLEVVLEEDRFQVLAFHRGSQLVVDLRVTVTDAEGRSWTMRPTGEFVTPQKVDARMGVLLYSTPRPIRLVEGIVPAELAGSTLTVRLYNPGPRSESQLSSVGEGYSIQL